MENSIAWAVGYSFVYIFAILYIRTRIRSSRGDQVSELQAILGLDDSYPSFEYVRTKYGVGVGEKAAQAARGKVVLPGERRWASLSLFIAAIPYMIMCSLGFIVLFGDLDAVTKSGVRGLSDTIYRNMFLTMSLKVDLLSSQAIVSAAFLGADVAPRFYPRLSSLWRFVWPILAVARASWAGAELRIERSA